MCGFVRTGIGEVVPGSAQGAPATRRCSAGRRALLVGGAIIAGVLFAGAGIVHFGLAGVAQPQAAFSLPIVNRPAAETASSAAAAAAPSPAETAARGDLPPLTGEDAYVAWMQAHHPGQLAKFLKARWERAKIALERGHIQHERLLVAFLLTPREWFVRAGNESRAYENAAMPIGYGQTVSGPDLVARMTDYLNLQPDQRVLEIGTGSGYQSALLSQLSDNVYTIEIVKPLAEETDAIYVKHTPEVASYANIHRRTADGYYGWPEHAPFDRIIVTCGIDHIPPELLKELAPGGIMVIPIGPPTGQTILKITKQVDANGQVILAREDIYHGTAKDIFVPFTAEGGKVHSLNTNLTP